MLGQVKRGESSGEAHGSGQSAPKSGSPPDLTSSTPGLPPSSEPAKQICRQCPDCLSALAHRLSQPLTALRGVMELSLLAERSPAEYREALEQAILLTDDLVSLIVALRELADSTAPGGPPERVPLSELVRASAEELRDLAESRGVKTRLAPSEEMRVWADPERLRDALLKLLHHILQRSRESGVIEISLSKSTDRACLTLCDPRPAAWPGEPTSGFKALTPGQLFSDAAKANSLQRVIAERLVEALGGTLSFESTPPQGCCFRLRLPLVPEGGEAR